MYQELYDLFVSSIFGSVPPSALAEYMLQFLCLFLICSVLSIPFIIIYGLVRRWF